MSKSDPKQIAPPDHSDPLLQPNHLLAVPPPRGPNPTGSQGKGAPDAVMGVSPWLSEELGTKKSQPTQRPFIMSC